jgi:hypothetical protein
MLAQVLLVFLVMIFIAYLIETLVEALLGPLFAQVPKLAPWKWTLMYIAIAAGVYAAFLYKFDVVYMLATFLGVEGLKVTIFGIVITGLGIGKGSNYLHDLLKKFFVKPTDVTTASSAAG